MELLPDDITRTLPKLYATERDADPVVRVKLFTPDSSWTWYVLEYDPEERLLFAFVIGHEAELGYVSLSELEVCRGPLGLPIERDQWFTPMPLSRIRAQQP